MLCAWLKLVDEAPLACRVVAVAGSHFNVVSEFGGEAGEHVWCADIMNSGIIIVCRAVGEIPHGGIAVFRPDEGGCVGGVGRAGQA